MLHSHVKFTILIRGKSNRKTFKTYLILLNCKVNATVVQYYNALLAAFMHLNIQLPAHCFMQWLTIIHYRDQSYHIHHALHAPRILKTKNTYHIYRKKIR